MRLRIWSALWEESRELRVDARCDRPCFVPEVGVLQESFSAVEALSEEVVLVISAAIAAFLGKKPRIRQIRLLGSAAWAQQGRVTIQASHALSVKHG